MKETGTIRATLCPEGTLRGAIAVPRVVSADDAVLYTAQSLTDEQQAQARANIGAGTPYTLPEASSDALGGVKADAAAETDTQPVRIGDDGKLYTAPGGGMEKYTLLSSVDSIEEAVQSIEFTELNGCNDFILTMLAPKSTASSGILIYLNNRQVNSFTGTYWMHPNVGRDIVMKLNCALPDDHYECRGMACQTNSIYGQDAVPGTIFGTTFLAGAELTSVKFAVANSNSQIPAGTSYKLYGRKIHVV